MSTTTTSSSIAPARARRPSRDERHDADRRHGHGRDGRQDRGGRVLFTIRLSSGMSDTDLARLARLLDLTTHMYPKMRPDPTGPGVARLDHFSGLFLERGPREGEWVLEARTWGRPAADTVREWEVVAAWVARQLDPAAAVHGATGTVRACTLQSAGVRNAVSSPLTRHDIDS